MDLLELLQSQLTWWAVRQTSAVSSGSEDRGQACFLCQIFFHSVTGGLRILEIRNGGGTFFFFFLKNLLSYSVRRSWDGFVIGMWLELRARLGDSPRWLAELGRGWRRAGQRLAAGSKWGVGGRQSLSWGAGGGCNHLASVWPHTRSCWRVCCGPLVCMGVFNAHWVCSW